MKITKCQKFKTPVWRLVGKRMKVFCVTCFVLNRARERDIKFELNFSKNMADEAIDKKKIAWYTL